uniref:4Fe-4S ferredoxin-type domain-containing protein n=1 Tax=Fundidesulfovibrio putealis TaxID=270496 RepID=A0A7C4EHI2_9BACT
MSSFIVVRDDNVCTRCMACVAKCKRVNRYKARVSMTGNSAADHRRADLKALAVLSCHHCQSPLCVDACPQRAIRRTAHGVAVVNEEDCRGCSSCADACPWHVPVMSSEFGPMVKCTLCGGKAAKGETPECVKTCPQGALELVRINDLSSPAALPIVLGAAASQA